MNLFDTIVLVGALVGLLFGIMGKATKRICSLLYTVLALIIAYFACGTLVSGVMGISVNTEQTLEAYLIATLSEVTAEFNMPMATIIGLVEGIVKLLAFYILFFIVNFVVNLIGKIVVGIILKIKIRSQVLAGQPVKRFTALKTFGIFGAIKWSIIAFMMILPITVLAPIVPDVAKLVIKDEATATEISNQVEQSSVIKFADGLYSSTKLGFMVYSDGETDYYLYDDIKSIKGFLKMASIFMPAEGEEVDPIKQIANMTDEDITEMLTNINQSESTKEILNTISDELELGIDFKDVDLAEEADTIIAIKNLIDVSEEEVTFKEDITQEDMQNLTDALATSDIIELVAKNNEGMLEGVDDEIVNDIESVLQQKVDHNVITQDKMDILMSLFGK